MTVRNFLPWSEQRYHMDDVGNFFINDDRIEPSIIDGRKFLEIDWVDGIKKYPLELVIVCCFENVYYERYFGLNILKHIKPIFKDGDVSNYFPKNLTYLFHGILADPNMGGFFLIPTLPSYSINEKGVVFSYSSKIYKTWSTLRFPEKTKKKSGYKYGTYYEDNGSRMCYQHRLLCLVFKKLEGIYEKMVVNHKDGDKENNDLSNLEWCTYSENNQHAHDTRLIKRSKRVLVKNLLTEEILIFDKVKDITRWLGEDSSYYVYERLKDRSNKVYSDFLAFKHDDGSEWPDFCLDVQKSDYDILNVAALNVFTGTVTLYNNVSEASCETEVSAGIILDQCRQEKLLPTGSFNFRFLNKPLEWPRHSKEHLEIYKLKRIKHRSGVMVFDHFAKKNVFFASQELCAEAIGAKVSYIRSLIVNQRKFEGRYQLTEFDPLEELMKEANQQRSYPDV